MKKVVSSFGKTLSKDFSSGVNIVEDTELSVRKIKKVTSIPSDLLESKDFMDEKLYHFFYIPFKFERFIFT